MLAAVAPGACAGLDVALPGGVPTTAVSAGSPRLGGREVVELPLARQAPATRSAATAPTALATISSSAPATRGVAGVPITQSQAFDVVPVYWGTDRKIPSGPMALVRAPATSSTAGIVTGSIDKAVLPGIDRGDRLVVGRSYVTVPHIARDKGSIQRPWQVGVLNVSFYAQKEDPRRHFTLGSFEPMDQATFARLGNEQLAKAVRNPGQALVFVHGFNSTFEDALYRTAQLAYDLEFDGVPYLYSWPSRGEETGYLYDRDSADRAQRYFLEFLEMVAKDSKAERIHLVAHSLGNRPLLEALRARGNPAQTARKLRIDQIVLAAPDIDRDVFVEIARAVNGAGRNTTLYAAHNDRALKLSRTLARGASRAGDVPDGGPVVVAGVETIDITAAGTDALLSLNHNTYAEGGHVLADLRALFRDGVHPPDKRFPVYLAQTSPGGTYWRYVRN